MGYLWDIYGKTHNKERNKIGARAKQLSFDVLHSNQIITIFEL